MKLTESSIARARSDKREDLDQEFLRLKGVLKLVAGRVLKGADDMEEALEKSYRLAAGDGRRFSNEGALRQWLIRTVLSEALLILHEKESRAESGEEAIFCEL
jgi:hypothetical protein